MRPSPRPSGRRPEEQEPIYWFALLDRAIHSRDNDAARHAIARLARLGIEVRFLLPPSACAESEAAHV